MPIIEFPYTLHKQYLMPIIPLLVENHKLWAFVDSGATFSIFRGKDKGHILNIKYSAENWRWHYKGQR